MPLPLVLTLGEPAGIGPDILLTAWQRRAELELPPFYVRGDPDFLARRAASLRLGVPMTVVTPDGAGAAFPAALPVAPLGVEVTARPGHPDASSGPAAIASIRQAVVDVIGGKAAAVVTNPVAKSVLYRT